MRALSHDATPFVADSALLDCSPEPTSRTLPPVWRPLVQWFTSYSRRYIGKHFNSLGVSRSSSLPSAARMPIVLYANHASWWDPLVGLVLKSVFLPNYTMFAPIDAVALRKYQILTKIGFFGVERQSRKGVVEYLRTAETILRGPGNLLAVTPHGRFTDARERPVRLQRGLGFLATRVERALFLPVAVEYAFWDQPLPGIFCRFGEPTEICATDSTGLTARHWTAAFERRLEIAQEALAKEVCGRDPKRFEDLLRKT